MILRLLCLVCCLSVSLASYSKINGEVYIDANANQIFDKGEKPVRDAIISDGLNVVKTDKKGRFVLPSNHEARFVTLYLGADMKTSKRYIKIDSSIKNYSFGIEKVEAKSEVSFVQISDTETFEQREWVDNLKKYIRTEQPDFVVHTGDICYESGMKWHAENLMSNDLSIPMYYCLGNHDLIKGTYGEEYFESKFGPAWYAFEKGATLYIVTPMMGGDYKPSFTHEYIGTWLKNIMEVYGADQPKIVFNHDLLTDSDDFKFKVTEQESIDLNANNLKAWLYGHWHVNRIKEHGDSGVKSYGTATIMGGIDHSPACFRVVNVDEKGNTTSDLRWAYQEREIKIVSPLKGNMRKNGEGKIRISVNTYDTGSPVEVVRYAVYGEKGFNWKSALDTDVWNTMSQESDWNWSTSFVPKETGTHTLVVDAILANGEVLHDRCTFEVTKSKESGVQSGEWTNLGGNKEHFANVTTQMKFPYHLRWTQNLGSNISMSSPLLSRGKVFSATFDDGNAVRCFISCFDASSGELLWKQQSKNGIKGQMVIAKDLLLGTDVQGFTYAYEIGTGKLRWKKSIEYDRLPAFITGLVTDGEVLYTGFGNALVALDVETGKELWRNKDWNGGEGTTPTMTIAEDLLIVSRHWGAIYAHDRFTGKVKWTRKDDGLRFRDGVVCYTDGSLWVAERSGSAEGHLFQLDLQSGKTIGGFDTGMKNTGTSAPVVLEESVIVAGSHPGIASFEKEGGKQLWLFETEASMIYTPSYFSDREQSIESTPIVTNTEVLFGALDGRIYCLDRFTGNRKWFAKVGAPILTSVAVGTNCFYVCDFAGNMYCFETDPEN